MSTRMNRRRAIAASLAGTATAASAFLAWGPAFAADTPPSDSPIPAAPVPTPAVADPVVSGTDLVVWNLSPSVQLQMQQENVSYAFSSTTQKSRHDTSKNTIQNVR